MKLCLKKESTQYSKVLPGIDVSLNSKCHDYQDPDVLCQLLSHVLLRHSILITILKGKSHISPASFIGKVTVTHIKWIVHVRGRV